MLGDFLYPVLWAAVIAIIFTPLYRKILKSLGDRANLASLTTVVIACAIVVVPLFVISSLAIQESTTIYQTLKSKSTVNDGAPESFLIIEQISSAVSKFEMLNLSASDVEKKLEEELAHLLKILAGSVIDVGRTTLWFGLQVAITIYLMFFFFRDGKKLKDLLLHYLPLDHKDEVRLIDRFANTSQAVVQGTLLIALIQGALGGLALWIAGVPAPVLWGVVMTILAIIPAVGASLIWLPAGISLLVAGEIWQGAFVLGTGTFLVSVIDEFLRPVFVGRRANLPDAVVLLATLGGLHSFGISGFILGPIIAALCLSLWSMFEEKYRSQLLIS